MCSSGSIGKWQHHAVPFDRAGKRLFDQPLPNDEARLRAVPGHLAAHGILRVVDRPATIGALPVAVAQAKRAPVGYLPGLAMRRICLSRAGESLSSCVRKESVRGLEVGLGAIGIDKRELFEGLHPVRDKLHFDEAAFGLAFRTAAESVL